ncbi:MAG: hypothetical protein WB014_05960 [Methanosarcina sp.]
MGGAFCSIGIDPDSTSIGIKILTTLNALSPNSNTGNFIFILTAVGLILSAFTFIVAWQLGRELGFFCIDLAWVGGFIFGKFSANEFFGRIGIILVIISVLIGRIAVD